MGCFISFSLLTSSGKMWEGTFGRTQKVSANCLGSWKCVGRAEGLAVLGCDAPALCPTGGEPAPGLGRAVAAVGRQVM